MLPIVSRKNAHHLLGVVTLPDVTRFMNKRHEVSGCRPSNRSALVPMSAGQTMGTTERHTGNDHTRRFYDRISRAYDLIADASEHAIRDVGIRTLGLSAVSECSRLDLEPVGLAAAVGRTGYVHSVDVSTGMMSVARARVESDNFRNVSLSVADARALCFCPDVFDAVFMSFTLELFDAAIPLVLDEMRRVFRQGGRLVIVAMAETAQTNPSVDVYQWLHRQWPHVVDCRPIDIVSVLQAAGFQATTAETTTIWGLPVAVVIGVEPPDVAPEDAIA